MDASDLIRALPNSLRGAGRPHMDEPRCLPDEGPPLARGLIITDVTHHKFARRAGVAQPRRLHALARAGSRLARGEGDIGGTLELNRGENCPRRRKSCSRIKSAPFCKRWLAKAWRSTCRPTQIYTHVLDERMKAMVRDLRPLIGE